MWFGLAFQNFFHPEYIVELKYIESKLYTGDFGHVGRTTRWRSRIYMYRNNKIIVEIGCMITLQHFFMNLHITLPCIHMSTIIAIIHIRDRLRLVRPTWPKSPVYYLLSIYFSSIIYLSIGSTFQILVRNADWRTQEFCIRN